MRSQRKCDIVAGAVIALLGAVVVYAASQIRGDDLGERLPPRTLPYIVGILTLGGGAGLALKSLGFKGQLPDVHWPDRGGLVRIVVNLLLLALFVVLLGVLGMPVATFLYVTAAIWYLDRERIVGAFAAGAISSLVVYFLFMKLLELPLPMGFLER